MVNYWKIVLATMVIVGTGVVTGGLLVQHASRLRPAHSNARATASARPAPLPTPAGLKLDYLRRMEKELDLTAEQRERVDRIISQSQDRARKIIEPLRPQLTEEVKRARQEFGEVLTPPQRTRLDELARQQQQHNREQREQHRTQPSVRDRAPETAPSATNSPPAPKSP